MIRRKSCIICGLKKKKYFPDPGNPAYLFLGESQEKVGRSNRLKKRNVICEWCVWELTIKKRTKGVVVIYQESLAQEHEAMAY